MVRHQTIANIYKAIPSKDPLKFPSLPTQSPTDEGWYWEELSDLFVNTVQGVKTTEKYFTRGECLKLIAAKKRRASRLIPSVLTRLFSPGKAYTGWS